MALIDSYSKDYQNTYSYIYGDNYYGHGCSFTNVNLCNLNSVIFYLAKFGYPTGNAVAKIYAHSGTYGASSLPTGSALAVSEPFDVSALTSSYQLITFNFTGVNRIALSAATYYCVTIEYTGGDASNNIRVGTAAGVPVVHSGNTFWTDSGWVVAATWDTCFYIYSLDVPTITTEPASNIQKSSVELVGNIIDDGGDLTSRGFEYGFASGIYTETITQTTDLSTGEFSETLEGLKQNEKIYYRAYATNSRGTSYGDEENVTTAILPPPKQYFCKIFDINGYYIKSWSDASFDGFTQNINGGLGQCNIKLARKFDDFGEGNDVKLGNEVQIWVSDKDSGSMGRKIYSGFISKYEPFLDGIKEGVTITCLGYSAHLSHYPLMDSSSSYTKAFSSLDCSAIMKGLIDNYRLFYPYSGGQKTGFHRINYTESSTGSINMNTGNVISYTFANNTIYEAIEKIRQFAPANWWWYIGADNLLQFKEKPKQPTHNFVR